MRNLIFIVILFMTTNVLAKTDDSITYTEDKNSVTIVSDIPEFTIRLKSNPSTGYSWFLQKYNNDLIQPVRHTYEPAADKKLVGAPGSEVWVFRMKPAAFTVPQETNMHFVYVRPWDVKDQPQALEFHISTISAPLASHSQKLK